jgi:hypothetical protein
MIKAGMFFRILWFLAAFAWPGFFGSLPELNAVSGNALEERAQKVEKYNEELIQTTLRAYGGDYIKSGQKAMVIYNGNIYSDFEIVVVRSKYLIIKTKDGTIYLEVEK